MLPTRRVDIANINVSNSKGIPSSKRCLPSIFSIRPDPFRYHSILIAFHVHLIDSIYTPTNRSANQNSKHLTIVTILEIKDQGPISDIRPKEFCLAFSVLDVV